MSNKPTLNDNESEVLENDSLCNVERRDVHFRHFSRNRSGARSFYEGAYIRINGDLDYYIEIEISEDDYSNTNYSVIATAELALSEIHNEVSRLAAIARRGFVRRILGDEIDVLSRDKNFNCLGYIHIQTEFVPE